MLQREQGIVNRESRILRPSQIDSEHSYWKKTLEVDYLFNALGRNPIGLTLD